MSQNDAAEQISLKTAKATTAFSLLVNCVLRDVRFFDRTFEKLHGYSTMLRSVTSPRGHGQHMDANAVNSFTNVSTVQNMKTHNVNRPFYTYALVDMKPTLSGRTC